MNKKEIEKLTQEDCYIPEPTKIHCFNGHNISEEKCVVCGNDFDGSEEAGCVIKHRKHVTEKIAPDGHRYEDVTYEEIVVGHICMSCYEELPDKEDTV